MAIRPEHAAAHARAPAVTCCRFSAGTVIGPANLEDPTLLPELEQSGALKIPPECLRIGDVLGGTLKETVDGLTPLTREVVELRRAPETDTLSQAAAPGRTILPSVKIHIQEGRDIQLEIPVLLAQELNAPLASSVPLSDTCPLPPQERKESPEENPARQLVRKYFKVEEVRFGSETKLDGATLYLRSSVCDDAVRENTLASTMTVDLITPDRYGEDSDTILDVQPIAVKESEQVGEGVTRVLDGVVLVLTGTDDEGAQLGEFGSSAGTMSSSIMWGRPGAPDPGEILIKTKVTIPPRMRMQRPGPLAVHKAVDRLAQEIREALKTADERLVAYAEEIAHQRRPGQKKVVLIKEIMGQGAMHDHLLLPLEPVGVLGAHANVDLGNMPIVMSPLQVLDGGIHAVTCVGPASKETSRQYWREPLVQELLTDPEVDFCGVIIVGSPQAQHEKMYVSRILGATVEALDLDGGIITTEGFGNNHIDFASHIEQIGKRGVPVVGVTYAAVQGQLVVGNEYMDALVELNKSPAGIENEILAHNCLTLEDAVRAVAMLKAKMAGEPIQAAESGWRPEVKLHNLKKIEEATGRQIAQAEDETTLPPRTTQNR